MSRRLELIPTGYVDYGGAAKGALQGFQLGMNIVAQEEERQRRLQEMENQKMSVANQVYRANQSDIERFGTDLSTEEKLKFTTQFDELVKMNRGIQELVLKGGKVGSPEYNALQDAFEKKKKTIQMNIGAIKEVKDGINQAVTLQKSGYEGFENNLSQLTNTYKNLLNGNYIPSSEIPSKTTITQNAYLSPNKIIEASVPRVSVGIQDHVVKDDNRKVIRTEKKQVPVYTDLETTAYDIVNAPAVQSAGVMKNYSSFIAQNKDGIKPEFQTRYELYDMYMREIGKEPKKVADFQPQDYTMMEILSRKYKPAPDQTEKFQTQRKGSSGTVTGAKAAEMQKMVDDYFSGDPKRRNSVISKLSGAMKTKGWSINIGNNGVSAKGSGNEYDPNPKQYSFGLDRNDENVSSLKGLINSYFGAIGSAGVKVE